MSLLPADSMMLTNPEPAVRATLAEMPFTLFEKLTPTGSFLFSCEAKIRESRFSRSTPT